MAAMVIERDVAETRTGLAEGEAKRRSADRLLIAELRERRERGRRRVSADAWSSSLNQADLACLLQVIEGQLLPRLLRDYRPSHRSPLGASIAD